MVQGKEKMRMTLKEFISVTETETPIITYVRNPFTREIEQTEITNTSDYIVKSVKANGNTIEVTVTHKTFLVI